MKEILKRTKAFEFVAMMFPDEFLFTWITIQVASMLSMFYMTVGLG
jgi:hypothetical protein